MVAFKIFWFSSYPNFSSPYKSKCSNKLSKKKKKNKVFKRYKNNGYKNEDKVVVDRLRNECQDAIVNAKENYYKNLGIKLADPTTGQKSYWKILNKLLNKCKIPKIPPLLVDFFFLYGFFLLEYGYNVIRCGKGI